MTERAVRINFVEVRLKEIKKQLNLVTEALNQNDWALLKLMVDTGVSPHTGDTSEKPISITEDEKKIILKILSNRFEDYDVDVLLVLRNEYLELFSDIDSVLSFLYRELLQEVEKLCVMIMNKEVELT